VSLEAKDLFQQNAGEAGQLLQQATDRFAEVMHGMKKMSVDMQRELEATRKELRRGVLELPEETAESMAQMRRVIVDQMEALAELNRIVARHGRAMDAVGAGDPAGGGRRGYGNEEPVISVALAEPAGRGRAPREPAPPPAGTTDWGSLQQRNRADAPPEPARQPPAADWNSLQPRGRNEASSEAPARGDAAAAPERSPSSRGRSAEPPPETPVGRATRGRVEPPPESQRLAAPQRGRTEPPPPEPPAVAAGSDWAAAATRAARIEPSPPEPPPASRRAEGRSDSPAAEPDWGAMGRSRAEPAPPEPPPRTAADWGTPRGRVEPPLAESSRPAAGVDRNGSNGTHRGRIDTPPEPPLSRSVFDAPPAAPAAPEAGKAGNEGSSNGSGGGWLSNLLTRASRDGEEAAHNDDRGAKAARQAALKERMPSDDDRSLRLGIESVDSLSVDIDRMIDPEAAADLWERRNRGDRSSVNVRRLYTPQGRKAFDEMRKRYKIDREFRQAVDRYIGQFDQLLGDVGHQDGGSTSARNYITSEAGKVYTMLAHAAGRFD
jgi:hypothetical protein